MPTQVEQSWIRIERWLAAHAPRTAATLRPPAAPAAIAESQRTIGVTFSDDLIASLLRHDGCTHDDASFRLPGDYRLMPVADIVPDWRIKTDALAQTDTDRRLLGSYWHPGWIPFADTNAVDALVVDCRPGGAPGAVGTHLKGDGTHFGTWTSVGALLAEVADALERRRPIGTCMPVSFDGRLSWEIVREQHPAPGSVFDLAAEAPVPGIPQARAVGEVWRVDDDSPLGLRVRAVAAEAGAAVASRTAAGQPRQLLTEPERMAWMHRHAAAEAIVGVLAAMSPVAGGHLLSRRLSPDWRAQFMTDLGELAIPDGAIDELVAAEERAIRSARRTTPLVWRSQRPPVASTGTRTRTSLAAGPRYGTPTSRATVRPRPPP
ncbi:SMI1/KNR4 family protein [Rugosimonospora africana]|uniref:Knr4/Smi1-like domain-containing protein n=1 Tax=Rugosimonospora africana TaxID=556532 RepID=A0A8J3QUF9_9ACTN|nr:SMI1/KNR4 family protein [Rugosimonospora africana]GIH17685.1 hypothetical protein Raf01_58570 [Rugosimonospora africana]